MRFLAAILGMVLLAAVPARAFAPVDHPASVYTGEHYVFGDAAENYQSGGRTYHRHARVAHKSVHRSARAVRSVSASRFVLRGDGCSPTSPQSCPAIDLAFDAGWTPREIIANTGRILAEAGRAVKRAAEKVIVEPSQRVVQFFLDKGYSLVAAVGIAGHIKAESNFNVHDVGDGGRARGLAQWHPDRYALCRRLARESKRDLHDYDLQLECIDTELRTREEVAYRALQRAKDVDDAVVAFAHFERPYGYSPARPRATHDFRYRYREAVRFFERYKDLKPQVQEVGI